MQLNTGSRGQEQGSNTMSLLRYFAIFLLFTCKTFAIQFGFIMKDNDINLVDGRFVAFGVIPEGTSSKVQSEMRDFMDSYVQEELRIRSLEEIDRQTFNSQPEIISTMKDGRLLLGLKGELSTFLKLLRFSCKRLSSDKNTWKNAVFLSEPTIIIGFNEMVKFTRDFEVELSEVVFVEDENDEMYWEMMKRDSSLTPSEEEESQSLLPSSGRTTTVDHECCCKCIII